MNHRFSCVLPLLAASISLSNVLPQIAVAQTKPVKNARVVLPPQNTERAIDPRPRIERIVDVPPLRNSSIGILVRSLDDGRTLYERNANLALLPASNQKILTAMTALSRLGAGFQYVTNLLHTGSIDKNGTLKGDLYLRGSGDPSLTSQRLLDMAQDLKKAGVKRITGRIIGDATRFDNRVLGEGWEWDDEPYYYSPQVSALCCDENVIEIEVVPAEMPGDPAIIHLGGHNGSLFGFDNSPFVHLVNSVKTVAMGTGGKETTLTFERARARNDFTITGSIGIGAKPVTSELTIEDPALFAATRLAEVLPVVDIEAAAAKNRRIETGITPADAVPIVESRSLPLRDMVRFFLKNSDNLYGEVLLKTVGMGTTSKGARSVLEALNTYRIDTAGLNIADGSGLSRHNTVTPRQLVGALTAIDQNFSPELRDAFQNALPVGGSDGTLRNRFKGTFAEGNVRAKTGSLGGVSSLSGYVKTRAGERLVFSILMNNFQDVAAARAAQDAIVLALTDAPRPARKH